MPTGDLHADLHLPDRADPGRDPAVVQRRALFHLHREDADLRPRGLLAALVRLAPDLRAPERRRAARLGVVEQAWEQSTWIQATKNSLIIGVWSTILATVLGTLAALGLSRPEMPYRQAIMAILISPMIVPIIIIATGLFFFYSQRALARTYLGRHHGPCDAGHSLRHHHGDGNARRLRPVAEPGRRLARRLRPRRPSSRSSCR